MQMDLLTVTAGVVSFIFFLLIHVISFRWLRPEELLKSLLACALAIAVIPIGFMAILFVHKAVEASLSQWILASFVAFVITGILSFVYILCIFGPYETSVRMRLVREIAKGKDKGITMQELLDRYNAGTIVKIRLRRLVGSGDIVEKKGGYSTARSGNFFLIFDAIAGVIKKWIEA